MGSKQLKKPEPRACGAIRYRAIRGPKEGAWYWRAERYSGGASETIWTGWATVQEADRIVAGFLTGQEPRQEELKTVRDLLSCWHGAIEQRSDLDPKTIHGYGDGAIRVRDAIGKTLVTRLDRSSVEIMISTGLRSGRTHRGVASDLKILRLAWRWGRELGLVPDREFPSVKVKLPDLDHPRPSEEEIALALEQTSGAVRVALALLVATGARRVEICQLQYADISFREGAWWLKLRGKARKNRNVPVMGDAARILCEWLEENPGQGENGVWGHTTSTMHQYLHRELHRLNLPWQPHALRRGAVDRLYAQNIDPSTSAKILGHSPVMAISTYRGVRERDILRAAEQAGLDRLPGKVIPLRKSG